MLDVAMIEACAPSVAVETVQAIVRVESQGDPLALNSNRPKGNERFYPQDLGDALQIAQQEIRVGNSVDIGLMQINSKNLLALNVTLPEAFNPCVNLRMGAKLLTKAYTNALKTHKAGQDALRAALSAYNTGNFVDGFDNGYVARYYEQRKANDQVGFSMTEVYAADPTVFIRNSGERP